MDRRVFVTRGIFPDTIDYLQQRFEMRENPSDRVLSPSELREGAQG